MQSANNIHFSCGVYCIDDDGDDEESYNIIKHKVAKKNSIMSWWWQFLFDGMWSVGAKDRFGLIVKLYRISKWCCLGLQCLLHQCFIWRAKEVIAWSVELQKVGKNVAIMRNILFSNWMKCYYKLVGTKPNTF